MIKINEEKTVNAIQELVPDLTPMLDILFILLVFFLLTAGAVFQSLDLVLPSSVKEELTLLNEPKHIMLEIRKEGYSLDGNEVNSFDELKNIIYPKLKEKPNYELIVAGDKTIPIERFLKVLTHLQTQGIHAANILMQNENKN